MQGFLLLWLAFIAVSWSYCWPVDTPLITSFGQSPIRCKRKSRHGEEITRVRGGAEMLAIVVPTYNTRDMLRASLTAVLRARATAR